MSLLSYGFGSRLAPASSSLLVRTDCWETHSSKPVYTEDTKPARIRPKPAFVEGQLFLLKT